MSATEILEQIRRLPPEEQEELVALVREEFGDPDHELAAGEAELIDRRLREHRDHPDDVVPWEQVKADLDARHGR